MNAQAVRRTSGSRTRKAPARGRASSKAMAASQKGASSIARWAFGLFVLASAGVAAWALDLPAKAGLAAGSAAGDAGFAVDGYQIVGLERMDRQLVDKVVTAELQRAGELSRSGGRPAQPLVDVGSIRRTLLGYGWVKDARVSRRLPDQLVVDIVERKPAAVWQNRQQLSLIDSEGVVLAPVPVERMPDLPLLIGPGANRRASDLAALLDAAPTIRPQVASASWIGGRRWDLILSSGETVSLPEGDQASRALQRFAKMDKASGLIGRGIKRFDLRVPGKMIVRLPQAPPEIENMQDVQS